MKTIYYVAASLDGYIASPDGSVGFLDAFGDVDYGYNDFAAGIDTVVMGRSTYDQVLTFGDYPYADKRSIIISHRPITDAPPDCILHQGPLQDVAQHFTDKTWIVGGGNIAGQLLKLGLITEIELYLIPVILGGGIPLFGDEEVRQTLTPLPTKTFSNGVVRCHYIVD